MKIERTRLAEVILVYPRVFSDERGWFYESFNEVAFANSTACDVRFVQDNHSRSSEGVLRGLHFQLPPYAQGKLVRRCGYPAIIGDLRAMGCSRTIGSKQMSTVDTRWFRSRLPCAFSRCRSTL